MKLTLTFSSILILLLIFPGLVLGQGKSDQAKNNNLEKKVKIEVKQEDVDSETPSQGKPSFVGEKTKVELKSQGNKTVIKTENQFGQANETELTAEESQELEVEVTELDELEEALEVPARLKFKVNKYKSGFKLTENKFTAKTNYPLSINSETNELIVSTPAGTRVVTILPDAAINNMLRRGVLDIVDATGSGTPTDDSESTPSAAPDPIDNDATNSTEALDSSNLPELDDEPVILTTTDTGELVYEVNGLKNKKILGLIPVGISKKVQVSAESGEVVDEEIQGFWSRILNVISI